MFRNITYLAAAVLLTGCGFKPIYGSAGETNIGAELATVEIALIKDRIGQQLRNHLLDSINPGGTPTNPNYRLVVRLTELKQELAVKKSEISTRANLSFSARFELQGLKTQLGTSFSGVSQIVTSYNILSSDFGTLAAEQDARSRAVRELSADITNRIAAFLKTVRVS